MSEKIESVVDAKVDCSVLGFKVDTSLPAEEGLFVGAKVDSLVLGSNEDNSLPANVESVVGA